MKLKKPVYQLALAALLLLTLGCKDANQAAMEPTSSATVYFGGDILTMAGASPQYVEAVVVRDGKIEFTGSAEEAMELAGAGHQMVDLQGKTMLPGFLDAHSHYFSSLSVANQLNLYPPPSGPGQDVPSILQALKQFKTDNAIPDGELIMAYGYDDTVMPEGRLLNRDDLDAALPDNPVLVGHVSMHGGVLNSQAMERWDMSASTETPPGGVIVRKPGTNEPWGLIMETAYLPIFASLPQPTPEEEAAWTTAAHELYAANGITTAHEGATHIKDLLLMQRAAEAGAHLIDVVAYPFITDLDTTLHHFPVEEWEKYNNRLKIGGVKITIDGSPQGRTAAFTSPYLTGGPAGEQNWKGALTFPKDMIQGFVKQVYDLGVPLNLHANGDAAIDTFLETHEAIAAEDPGKDRNITLIHAQFTRKDHLPKFLEYKITPSFYTLHTYYFADAHIANRGREQAQYISPMRDAIEMGIRPTNHTDFVVAPLDQPFMLWSAVNRVSRGGEVVGEDQRISAYEGLQAMTINVAHQYQEESMKGTIEAGKLADLVIVDANPLKADPDAIKDIQVLETLKEGKQIYKKQ
ncbi:amidohydrolase [Robiginitalea sediminis]|uniref:amidohydrolase n=1 Tax=Robiginitalea sediminis TaxID=1982593 RepID=UPI0018EA0E3D|nr:amidohydrolase [Robiginitalea sediminis]